MSRIVPLVVAVLVSPHLGGQVLSEQVFAQLTPTAGSAGAGNALISGPNACYAEVSRAGAQFKCNFQNG
jgi:hypothetical protein